MKRLLLILPLYLLLISVVPCCAFDGCSKEIAANSSSNDKPAKECGTCSPFFNCSGCAVTSVIVTPAGFECIPQNHDRVYAEYKLPFINDVPGECWRPPQLLLS